MQHGCVQNLYKSLKVFKNTSDQETRKLYGTNKDKTEDY